MMAMGGNFPSLIVYIHVKRTIMCVCVKVVGCQNTYIYQKKESIEMKPDGKLKDEQLKLFHIRNEIERK